jgi:hypothetical protein
VLFLGALTSYLSLPLFWIIAGASLGGLVFWQSFPPLLLEAFTASMLAGQAVMLAAVAIAAYDARRLRLLALIPTLPFYWVLGALAAYRAIVEIFTRPSYWHKTEHGVSTGSRVAADPIGG